MPLDIDKYVEKDDDNFKFNLQFPKIKLPKIKLPKIKKPKIKLNQNITIILVVFIIAFAYIYVENRKIAYQEQIRQEKILNKKIQQRELEECLLSAEKNYTNNWDSQCKSMGKKPDCLLPAYRADSIEQWRNNAKKECMDKFKSEGFTP